MEVAAEAVLVGGVFYTDVILPRALVWGHFCQQPKSSLTLQYDPSYSIPASHAIHLSYDSQISQRDELKLEFHCLRGSADCMIKDCVHLESPFPALNPSNCPPALPLPPLPSRPALLSLSPTPRYSQGAREVRRAGSQAVSQWQR